MRPMAVVVIDVHAEDALELPAADDQDQVEALTPHGADEALGERVRLRRLDRRSHDLDPLTLKHGVEGGAELRVAIVDQKARRLSSLGQRPRELARLLRHPGAARVLGAPRYVHSAAAELDEEEDIEPGGKDGVDGEEVAREHARRLAADELAPGGSGSPARRSEPRLAQQLADRRRRDAESERGELAADPLIAPAGVLAREAEDERADLGADRGSAGLPCRIAPASGDELAMPA